jgi:hypothetical protein
MKRRNFIGGLAITLAVPLSLRASENMVARITLADRFILRQQDPETLAEWSCILNGWGWPKVLPDPEPPTYIPNGRRSQILRWIKNRIGREAVSWKHNQSVMSREQFDEWKRDSQAYREKYPLNSRDFDDELRRRGAHTRAMYARHGAKHLEYIEAA